MSGGVLDCSSNIRITFCCASQIGTTNQHHIVHDCIRFDRVWIFSGTETGVDRCWGDDSRSTRCTRAGFDANPLTNQSKSPLARHQQIDRFCTRGVEGLVVVASGSVSIVVGMEHGEFWVFTRFLLGTLLVGTSWVARCAVCRSVEAALNILSFVVSTILLNSNYRQ